MLMVFECVVCNEWFFHEQDVYQEDNGDCICVSCWDDNVEELMEKYYGKSSGSVQQN